MGIDADRLIFAAREDPGPHLARHRLADLFLDTLPYNAHTTAIDALWAGLPLITCRGEAFSARVAASLLEAIDLPELVAADLKTYESLARKLADDPARLIAIRKKIARNQAPLSDGDRFRQKLEAAYTKMWEICRDGQKPHGFAVQA